MDFLETRQRAKAKIMNTIFKTGDRVQTRTMGPGTIGKCEIYQPDGIITYTDTYQGGSTRVEVILDDPSRWDFKKEAYGNPYFWPRELTLIEDI